MESLVGKMFNAKSLKNMDIITELINLHAEIPKEDICNSRIPLEDFPIFLKPDALDVVIRFFESYLAGAILVAIETTSKKKKEIAKKHSKGDSRHFY